MGTAVAGAPRAGGAGLPPVDWFHRREDTAADATDERTGGFAMGIFVQVVLNLAFDLGTEGKPLTFAEVWRELDRGMGNQFGRMRQLHQPRPGDGAEDFVRQGLALLVARKFLEASGADQWVAGPRLVSRKRLYVLPGRHGRKSGISHTVIPRAEREARSAAAREVEQVAALTARLQPFNDGWRRLDEERLKALDESIEAFGVLDRAFPLLVDQHDRVLSGRHRQEIARRRGIANWAKLRIRVEDDHHAARVAWAANLGAGWSRADIQRLKQSGADPVALLNRRARRERIVGLLVANPLRTNTEIADEMKASRNFVAEVRAELTAAGVLVRTETPGDRREQQPRAEAEPSVPKNLSPALWEEVKARKASGEKLLHVTRELAERRAELGDYPHPDEEAEHLARRLHSKLWSALEREEVKASRDPGSAGCPTCGPMCACPCCPLRAVD